MPKRLCRDCGHMDDLAEISACPLCGGARLLAHAELADLAIAHIDCDAYYASIEKRDRPDVGSQPLIVGGKGERGVVLTCCYEARRFGVRSAMPMGKALQLCPQAVVVRPDMEKYKAESQRMRALMADTGAWVEPVSIDEAYMDLSVLKEDAGREPPARTLARLALKVEKRLGVTVSVGLASNKMLAKLASDYDKPRGFKLIGAAEAVDLLAPLAVGRLPGVGPVMGRRLEALGILTVEDLRRANADDLRHRFGIWARRLVDYAWGQDPRRVAHTRRRAVSVGAERTFAHDLVEPAALDAALRELSVMLERRLLTADLAAASLTLKLRRSDWKTVTRACPLPHPTQRAEVIFSAAIGVLAAETAGGGSAYRLLGLTANRLEAGRAADPADLFGNA